MMFRKQLRLRRERKLGLPQCFHDTGSIFVHVPKTGGISICEALYGQDFGHRPYKEWLFIDPKADLFSFAFVREPAERLLSAFTYIKNGGMNEGDRKFAENVAGMDFGQFVSTLPKSRTLSGWMHFLPQTYYLTPEVDFIGRFENIAADFGKVSDRLGVEVTLPHSNATKHPKPSLDQQTRRKIETIFEADYRRFGY